MPKSILVFLTCFVFLNCKQAGKETLPAKLSSSVIVVDPPFEMAGLDRNRLVRIYLPPGYASSDERYPVLYMHDGQNLFEDSTSYVGEWGVDEALDSLFAATGQAFIAVGIDNGREKRVNELNPWENEKYGAAEGEAYMD